MEMFVKSPNKLAKILDEYCKKNNIKVETIQINLNDPDIVKRKKELWYFLEELERCERQSRKGVCL